MSIKNDNIIHCSASGTESYDHCYSLGYKVGHEDWSPYPRVNALRKTFLDRRYDVDVEMLRLVTEAYQANEKATTKIRCARAFENILLNVTLDSTTATSYSARSQHRPRHRRYTLNFPWTGSSTKCSTNHSKSVNTTSSISRATKTAKRSSSSAAGGRERP